MAGREPRQAEVRFYFDEDVLGLAKVVVPLRTDCTYPGDEGGILHKRRRPPSPIARGTLDTVWVPEVARRGWLIITRDYQIRENPRERQAVRDSGARMVALSGQDAEKKWGAVELFFTRWRRIEALLEEPGPFIYRASRSRFERLDLDR